MYAFGESPAAVAQTAKAPPKKAPAAAAVPAAPAPRSLADVLPRDMKNEYEAGKILFEDRDYTTALLKFQDIYSKTKETRLLWNMAACLKNLRHYAKALDVLRQYVEAGDKLTPQELKDARDVMGAIEPFTTSVTFKVSEADAELFLDDESIGRSPLTQALVLDIGMRHLRVRKAGFRAVDKEIAIGGTKDATSDVTLEKSGGHLELAVAQDASVTLDDKPVGQGPLLRLDLSVGGHALVISAPKMHPYQGDVTIEDGQTRTLAIKLEPDAEQFAELRVAVGCRDPLVRTPNEGLTVYLDNSAISASPLGLRMRSTESGEVPAYIPFTVSPGKHQVTVRFPACEALSADVTAPPQQPGTVEGVLPPLNPFLNGSPAGSPNGLRVSAGFAQTSVRFKSFENFLPGTSASPSTDVTAGMAGMSATLGLQGRWTTFLLDARYARGTTAGSTPATTGNGAHVNLSENGDVDQLDIVVRFGFRIPLDFGALSFGPSANMGRFEFVPDVGNNQSSLEGGGGFWGALDAQPLCDFGVQVGGGYSVVAYASSASGSGVNPDGATSLFVHAVYEPNTLCERKRAGMYQLTGTR
jgi:hypothetical protein